MDAQCAAAANPGYAMDLYGGALVSGNGDRAMSEEEEDEEGQPSGNGSISTLAQHSPPALPVQTQSSALVNWTGNTGDCLSLSLSLGGLKQNLL